MRLLGITFISFLTLSSAAHAAYDNLWLELGASLSGTSIKLKTVDGEHNWAIEGVAYYSPLFNLYQDRATQITQTTKFTTLAVTKNWSLISSWGYLDAGVGLGLGKGSWVTNCGNSNQTYLFGTIELCDVHKGIRLGVPIHASAVFGKYFGIGLTVNTFVSTKQSYASLMLTFPFGDFTK